MDFTCQASRLGFQTEIHEVCTKDGYILRMFRIKPRVERTVKPLPVVMHHGLLADANFWIVTDPERSLPFILSSMGIDVWIVNGRGSFYSAEHAFLDPSNEKYWDFCFDEMAKYDIPALFHYVLDRTNMKKINYIGHSQGTTVLFAAPSYNLEIVDCVDNFFAISPVARVGYLEGFPKMVSSMIPNEKSFKMLFGNKEFMPKLRKLSNVNKKMADIFPTKISSVPLSSAFGVNYDVDDVFLARAAPDFVSSASVKNILHFYQAVKSGEFHMYDYGAELNMIRYNQKEAPLYDMSKCTYKVHIFSGTNDWQSPMVCVNWLRANLPNVPTTKFYCKWGHLDVIFGENAPSKVFLEIVKVILDE